MPTNTSAKTKHTGSKENRKIKQLTYKMQAKLLLVFCAFTALLIAVAIRLAFIDYTKGDTYQKRVLSQQTYVSNTVPFKRGSITDRKGTPLAYSEESYKLIFEPKTINADREAYEEATTTALGECFGIPTETIQSRMTNNEYSMYVVLSQNVTYEQKQEYETYVEQWREERKKYEKELSELNKKEEKEGLTPQEQRRQIVLQDEVKKDITGIWFETQYQRVYPYSTLASQVLGFSNSSNNGINGLEEYYNDVLNGTNGREYGYFNASGALEVTEIEARNGYNLVSTIDADAQMMVEQMIADYQKTEGAENVGIIIMNPNNGEIYVMATNRPYDLNNPGDLKAYYTDAEWSSFQTPQEVSDAQNAVWRNFCVSDNYEPGSTFKPFTVAACLEEDTVSENNYFTCDGHELAGGYTIHCVKRSGHGNISLKQSLEFSCNDVMMQISRNLGRTEFARYQSIFGLGTRTGIDLPAEAYGIIYDEEGLNASELATCSFGQGITVSMVQMAAGFSSLVNGGYYYRPHMVKSITNDAGLAVQTVEPDLIRKTVTRQTSEFIKDAVYGVVTEGTAKKAQAEGYLVGGKTGTAQKLETDENGRLYRSVTNYVLSFIGCVPADNPEAVIYVVLDQPHVEDQTACTSASVLASRITSEVLPVLGIYPTEPIAPKEDETPVEQPAEGAEAGENTDETAPADGTGESDAAEPVEETDPEHTIEVGPNANEDATAGILPVNEGTGTEEETAERE